MSTTTALPQLYSYGHALEMADDKVGLLRDSRDAMDDVAELHRRFDTDERVWNVLMFPEKNLVTEMENFYARRKYSEALSKGQEAIVLNPNDANALRLIAEITDKKAVHDNLNEKFLLCKNPDDHKKLLSEYNRLLKQDENNPDWYFGLARSYMAMNDLKAAENNLKKALELDRTFEDAILTRVELFKLKGDLPSRSKSTRLNSSH